MRTQEQLCIIEVVEVVDGVARAELDSLDLLQVHIEDALRDRRDAAVLEPAERLFERISELAVEHGRQGRVFDGVVALFRSIVHNFAAVDQQHELVGVDVDHGTVRHRVLRTLAVGAALIVSADGYARGEYGGVAHPVRLDHFKPLVGKPAADSAGNGFDNSHEKPSCQSR